MTQKVKKELEKAVTYGLGNEYRVNISTVNCTNTSGRKAATIVKDGSAVGAVIYIDDLLQNNQITMAEVALEIIERYKHGNQAGIEDCVSRIDKNYVLSKVIYRPIGTEGSRKPPKGVLCKDMLDIVMLYAVPVYLPDTQSHFNMTYDMLKKYGISEDELCAAALRNTKLKGFVTKSMNEVLAEMTGAPTQDIPGMPELYIITNAEKVYGASVMAFPEYFDALAQRFGNLYILPSSVHEVLAISVNFGDETSLREMVQSVNATEVAEEDFLSNSVYIYDAEKHEIRVA